jgi:hypothetical protein
VIYTWVKSAIFFLFRLFIPAPQAPADQKIDIHEKCPACGHRDAAIEAVQNERGKFIKRTCRVCGAWWHLKPILDTRRDLFLTEKAG